MKKIGLLVLAIVMALGALGVGYATFWNPSVDVIAKVDTANLEATIVNVVEYSPCMQAVVDNSNPDKGITLTITAKQIVAPWNGICNFDIVNSGDVPIYFVSDGPATGVVPETQGSMVKFWNKYWQPCWHGVVLKPGEVAHGQAIVVLNYGDGKSWQDKVTGDTENFEYTMTFPFQVMSAAAPGCGGSPCTVTPTVSD